MSIPSSSASSIPMNASATLTMRGLTGAFVLHHSRMAYYAPRAMPLPGRYTLRPYAPTAELDLPFRVYEAVVDGSPWPVVNRTDRQSGLPELYFVQKLNPNVEISTSFVRHVPSPLPRGRLPARVTAQSLEQSGFSAGLRYNNPDFSIHEIPNCVILMSLPHVSRRLNDVLTAF